MNGFVPSHIPVLRALEEVWGSDRFIVIGAAAVGYHIGMSWRGTLDLDLSVTAGIDKYTPDLEGLGWRRDQNAPQRWYLPEDLIVDVVPAEPSSVRAGRMVWPDGSAMNLLGFRLAFADAILVEIEPATHIRVASLRSIVVLKMSAYLDKPWERETDLAVASQPVAVVAADFNLDGVVDLAVANQGSNTLSILLGKGDGGFGAASRTPVLTRLP